MGKEVATVLAISAAISAGSAFMQHRQAKKAASAQKKAQRLQQRAADAKAARERVKTVREARIKRAAIVARAEGAGVGTASGAQAGQQNITQQLAGNLAFSHQMQSYGEQASSALSGAADAQVKGAMWGAIGGVSQNIFQSYGGYKTLFQKTGMVS